MICRGEAQLKKDLSLYGARPVTLLCGNEPVLAAAWRRRVLESLQKEGGEIERFDGKALDVDALAEAAQLLPMLGARRILWVEDLDPAALGAKELENLLALLSDFPPESAIVLTLAPGVLEPPKRGKTSLDGKLSAAVKKLTAAADRSGTVACLDKRTGASLHNGLIARCRQAGCELPPAVAEALVARCGDDLGTLQNECDKLCAYAGYARPITAADLAAVCPQAPDGDLYAVAKHLLDRDGSAALREVSQLLAQKTPPAQILANLGMAFCDLARASAARSAGKDAEDLARDLHFRFAWRAQNALRDCRRFDPGRIAAVCAILCEAETRLKTESVDARALLETAVVRSAAALRGAAP